MKYCKNVSADVLYCSVCLMMHVLMLNQTGAIVVIFVPRHVRVEGVKSLNQSLCNFNFTHNFVDVMFILVMLIACKIYNTNLDND